MSSTRVALPLLAVLLVTSACTGDSEKKAAAPPEPTASSSYVDAAPSVPRFDRETQEVTRTVPAFTVTTGALDAQICYDDQSADLVSFDYGWASEAAVEVTGLELIDAEGVEIVGEALTVPPVNVGGTINWGGEFLWKGRAKELSRVPGIRWSDREPVSSKSYSAGETGAFLLHLRYAQGQRGSSHGLRVTYTVSENGEDLGPFTAEVSNNLRWDVVEPGGRCRP